MNDELDQRIRNALGDIMDTAAPPAESPTSNVSLERPPQHDTSRRLLLGAATVAVIGGGIAALAIVQDGSTDRTESPTAGTEPPPADTKSSTAGTQSPSSATPASAPPAETVVPPTTAEPTPSVPVAVEATADEQERLRALEAAGESLGLKPTRMQVLIFGGERRGLDGAFKDQSGDLGVGFTISHGQSPPPGNGRFKQSSAGYQYRLDPYGAEVRRFDDAEEEFVSLRISVDMQSDREVDEQAVTEIADTLLAAI